MNKMSEITSVFCLDANLTITEVCGLQRNMLEVLRSSSALILDGSDVAKVDTAGIQLLTLFFRDAADRKLEIRWHGASERLQLAARQLGLDDILQLTSAD